MPALGSIGGEAESHDAGARRHRRRGRKPRCRCSEASAARPASIGGGAPRHRQRDRKPWIRSQGCWAGARVSVAGGVRARRWLRRGPPPCRGMAHPSGGHPCPHSGRGTSMCHLCHAPAGRRPRAGVEVAASTAHVLPRPSPKLRCPGSAQSCRAEAKPEARPPRSSPDLLHPAGSKPSRLNLKLLRTSQARSRCAAARLDPTPLHRGPTQPPAQPPPPPGLPWMPPFARTAGSSNGASVHAGRPVTSIATSSTGRPSR